MKKKTRIKSSKAAVAAAANSTLTHAPLASIVSHPEMENLYRKVNKKWVEDLTQDIALNGLDVPLITWAGGDTQQVADVEGVEIEPYFLIAGQHRRAALENLFRKQPKLFAKLFPLGVPVVHRKGSIESVLYAQVRENTQRHDATPEEIFPALKFLLEEKGIKQKEVAARLGKSEGWVSQMIIIDTQLPEDLKKGVVDNTLPIRDAQNLARQIKKAAESGDPLENEEVQKKIERARSKVKKKKTTVSKPEAKRLGPKAVWELYQGLSSKVTVGLRKNILESMFEYVLGATDDLPVELETIHKEQELERQKAAEQKRAAKSGGKKSKKAPKGKKSKKA